MESFINSSIALLRAINGEINFLSLAGTAGLVSELKKVGEL
jgi:hypothetical protein